MLNIGVHFFQPSTLHEGNDAKWLQPKLGEWLTKIMGGMKNPTDQGTFEIDIFITDSDYTECHASYEKG